MTALPLSLYLHIPYCKQKCSYCDFVAFEKNKILPSKDYVSFLKQEIRMQASFFKKNPVQTIYFGGGTPSLIPAREIEDLLREIGKNFSIQPRSEITIEINPGTLGEKKLKAYQNCGINRFSLGVQTFTPWFLKKSGRLHRAEDSIRDLKLLQKKSLNYSLDLLIDLPHQTLFSFKEDLKKALSFDPPHLTFYNLTVAKNHALSFHRPSEETQIEIFQTITEELERAGLYKYEISHFAKKGFSSRHNLACWEGNLVLGLGVGAHSYLPPSFCHNDYGLRFWNADSLKQYMEQRGKPGENSPFDSLPEEQTEHLKAHEALTDFCHTRLRRKKGLSLAEMESLFPSFAEKLVIERLLLLKKKSWVQEVSRSFSLTSQGEIYSNQVFLNLTFSEKELNFKGR